MATNVEVYWPDGRSVARPLEPSDINSVLEIRYPKDEDEVTPTAEIEVQDRVEARLCIIALNAHPRTFIFRQRQRDQSALNNKLLLYCTEMRTF